MASKSAAPEDESDPVVLEVPAAARGSLTVLDQYERNMRICAARVRNAPWSAIAAEHSLSVARCQQIFNAWADSNPTLREHDPLAIVDELLYGYQAVIEDCESTVARSEGTVRVGALNTKMRAYREVAELLQAIGVLPNDLGTMHLHIDGQITADRIITVLERFDVPDAVYEEILEALGGPTPAMLQAGEDTHAG